MSMNYNLQGTLNNYLQRFPQATLGQFRGYLNTNYPQMSNQFLRNLTAEELGTGLNQAGGLGKTAGRILGKGGKALGLAGLALTIPQMAQAYERNGVSGVAGETVRTTPQGMITEGALNFYIPQLNEIRNQQQLGETYLNNYNQLRNLGR